MFYSTETITSKLFQSLYIQVSSKNSLAFRLLKTKIALLIRSWFKKTIELPNNNGHYIGLLKHRKFIAFELENNEPVSVWKKNPGFKWEKSKFLGYQLISEYTVEEFHRKKKIITKALQTHWNAVNENPSNIHGDMTHFNILYNEKGELFFIDKKSINHSRLFDFFYFYSYYQQCISKCTTLKKLDELLIINDLKHIIKNICVYKHDKTLKADYSNLNIPEIHGLKDVNTLKKDFMEIFRTP